MTNGKGDDDRTRDFKAYREGYDRIFNNNLIRYKDSDICIDPDTGKTIIQRDISK